MGRQPIRGGRGFAREPARVVRRAAPAPQDNSQNRILKIYNLNPEITNKELYVKKIFYYKN